MERRLNTCLLGDADAEGASREDRATSGGEDEDEAISRSYHENLLYGNLRQAFHQATSREGGGCLLPDDQRTKTN